MELLGYYNHSPSQHCRIRNRSNADALEYGQDGKEFHFIVFIFPSDGLQSKKALRFALSHKLYWY